MERKTPGQTQGGSYDNVWKIAHEQAQMGLEMVMEPPKPVFQSPMEPPKPVFQSPMEAKYVSIGKSGKKKAKKAVARVELAYRTLQNVKFDIHVLRYDDNAVRHCRELVEKNTGGRKSRCDSDSTIRGPATLSLWPNPKAPMKLHARKQEKVVPVPTEVAISQPSAPDEAITVVEVKRPKTPNKGRELLRKASAWAMLPRDKPGLEIETPPQIPPMPTRPPPPPPLPSPAPAPWSYHPPTRKAIKSASRSRLRDEQIPPVPPLPSPAALAAALSLAKKASSPLMRAPFLKKAVPEVPILASPRNPRGSQRPRDVARRPTLLEAASSPSVPQGSVNPDMPILNRPRKRPGLLEAATSPSVPTRSMDPETPVASRPRKLPGLLEAASSPSVPQPLVDPDIPIANKTRKRPMLRAAATTPATRTVSNIPPTPHSPLQPAFPHLHARPTIGDLVATERAHLHKNLPPLPPMPACSFKRTVSDQITAQSSAQKYGKANYYPPNPYGGNAFAPSGYWGTQPTSGLKKDNEGFTSERKLLEKTLEQTPEKTAKAPKQGSFTNLAKTRNFSRHSQNGSTEKAQGERKSASVHRKSTQAKEKVRDHVNTPVTHVRHDSARLAGQNSPRHFSFESDETLVYAEAIPLEEIWKSIGRNPRQYASFEHPFPDFEVLCNSAMQESFLAIRDAVVAFYLSRKTDMVVDSSQPSIVSLQSRSTTSSKRPSTGRSWSSRELTFRNFPIFARKASAMQELTLLSDDIQHSRIKSISSLPSSAKSKKKRSMQSEHDQPAYDNVYERALRGSMMVLREVLEKFMAENENESMGISEYMLTRPAELARKIGIWDNEEDEHLKKHDIRSVRELRKKKTWLFSTDERADFDSRFHANPYRGAHETALDQQRNNLKEVYEQRNEKDLDIPTGAYNVIWAVMFVNWSEMACVDELEKRISQVAEQTKSPAGGMKVSQPEPEPDSDSDDSDSSIGVIMKRYGVERDVRTSTSMNLPTRIEDVGEIPEVEPAHKSEVESEVEPETEPEEEESPLERKRRYRLTQFNMGFQGPASPTLDLGVSKRRVNAIEEEELDWAQQLAQSIAKEKERQQSCEKRGRSVVIQEDPRGNKLEEAERQQKEGQRDQIEMKSRQREREKRELSVAKEKAQLQNEAEEAERRERKRQRDEIERKARQQAAIHARYWERNLEF